MCRLICAFVVHRFPHITAHCYSSYRAQPLHNLGSVPSHSFGVTSDHLQEHNLNSIMISSKSHKDFI